MNKVTLIELPTLSLNSKYARRFEGTNKITHYSVSLPLLMTGADGALDRIKAHIVKEEGPTEFEIQEFVAETSRAESAISILARYPKTQNALEKSSCNSSLFQEYRVIKQLTAKEKLLNKLIPVANYVIRLANKVRTPIVDGLYRLSASEETAVHDYVHTDRGMGDSEFDRLYTAAASAFSKSAKKRPYNTLDLYVTEKVLLYHPCTYLSVTYEEQDRNLAEMLLLDDLNKFSELDMILGHLAMPTRLLLGNGSGSGKRIMVTYCFLFVDNLKIPGLNPNPMTWPNKPCLLDGICTAAHEGMLFYPEELDYRNRYEITDVFVDNNSEAIQDAVVSSYNAQRAYIEKRAAQRKAALLKNKGL